MARELACCTAAMPLRPLASGWLRPGALKMDTQRLILLFIFGFSLLMLWEAWDKEHRPKPPSAAPTPQQGRPAPATPDLLLAESDTLGGPLKRLELLRHKDSSDPSKNFELLGPHHAYEAQSG